jgi:hypothetical protein
MRDMKTKWHLLVVYRGYRWLIAQSGILISSGDEMKQLFANFI